MEMITVSAKTVDDAITKALIQLETTSDKLEYEVVEKGSSWISRDRREAGHHPREKERGGACGGSGARGEG